MRGRGAPARARLEREAGDAVRAFTYGRRVDARRLTDAPPGQARGGAGRGLAPDLRARLEALFDADLGAVRVHEGPAAHAITGAARGVASGVDVYLGRGEAMAAPASMPVLVHEVTHVLQQTGRVDARGRVVATRTEGSGAALAWEAPFTATPPPASAVALIADWARVARDRGDATAAAHVDALVAGHRAAADAAAYWTARARHVLDATADPALATTGGPVTLAALPRLGRSALFDGLKLHGETAAAARLLQRHDDTESGVRHVATYQAYVDAVGVPRLLDRVLELWNTLEIFDGMRPRNALANTLLFLLGQFGAAADTSRVGALDAAVAQHLARETFLPNELGWATLHAVAQLERLRVQMLELPTSMTRVEVTHDATLDARITIAQRLPLLAADVAGRADAIRADRAYTAEARHLLVRDVAPAMGALGTYARDLWRGAAVIEHAAGGTDLDRAAAAGLPADTLAAIGTGAPPPFPRLEARLAAIAQQFFARDRDGAVVSSSAYQRRIRDARAAVLELVVELRGVVVERSNRAWNLDGRPFAFAAGVVPADRAPHLAQAAWLIQRLTQHRNLLASHDAGEDARFRGAWATDVAALVPPVPAWPGDDARVVHRGRVARDLATFAGLTHLRTVAAAVAPVLTASETWTGGAQAADVLAIAGGFVPDPDGPIERLLTDMGPGATIRGWEQFSPEQLVQFYQADHYRRVAAEIDAMLAGPEGRDFGIRAVPIVNQAHENARLSTRHPTRHTVDPLHYVYLARDPAAGGARADLRDLIEQHPIARVESAAWPLRLIPGRQGQPDLVMWSLPQPWDLAASVRAVAGVNQLLAEFSLAANDQPPLTVEHFVGLDDEAWWQAWTRLTDAEPARRRQLRPVLASGGLFATLAYENTVARNHLWLRTRAALVHERERIVRSRVLPLLAVHDQRAGAVDATTVDGVRVNLRTAAVEALGALETFFLNRLDDDTERAAHETAAVLRISHELRAKLVEQDGAHWTMRGWDRAVAWWWIPVIERVLERSARSPDLESWLGPGELPSASFVPAHRAEIDQIYEGLLAAMVAHQRDSGITGLAGDGTIESPGALRDVDRSREFAPGHPFTIDGETWEVMSVGVGFAYYPGLRRYDGRDVTPSILEIDGQATRFDGSRLLLQVELDGNLVEVRNDAAGDEVLRRLTHAVIMASIIEQLTDLAAFIEDGTMFVIGLAIDIAELFPVAGQAAAAARVGLTVASVLGSAELREFIGALITDPLGMVTAAWDEIRRRLNVEGMAMALLVDPGLEALENFATMRPGATRRPGASTSRIGRILRRLASVGRAIGASLGRVVGRAHDVRDDLQAVAIEHRMLGRVLDLVGDNLYLLAALPDIFATLDLTTVTGNVTGGVRDTFGSLLQAFDRLRLPAQLIRDEDIVGFVLDLVGRRLGGKYALGYRVIRALLEAVGEWDTVVATITRGVQLIGSPAALINRWGEFLQAELGPLVNEAQDRLHDVLASIYRALPGVTDALPAPVHPNIVHGGDQFLDAEPLVRPGAARVALATPVELDGGRPLAPRDRQRFERQFGQDLGHVRVHTDAAAARATYAAGARALTTGSHIAMAPDVALGTDAGQRVLRHELVHVLQQTGPRRPGEVDATPTVGEPGVGLRIDPDAEAVADALSAQLGPVAVAPTRTRGAQPDLLGIGQRFIDYVIHPERATAEVARIERTGTGTGRALIGREVRDDVAHVGAAIQRWIAGLSAADIDAAVRPTFQPALTELKAWLQHRATAITGAVNDLAIDASVAVRRRDDTRESPEMRLEVEAFERKLQRFITIDTGCSVDIELRHTGGRLDRANPLRSARLSNLFPALIPYTDAGRALWDLLLRNTFTTAQAADVHVRTHARILLFAAGAGDNVWEPTRFRLQDRLAAQIVREGGSVRAITLPPAASFWYGTSTADRPSDPTLPALWIGAHGDATHHGQADRQSHHTTQYLLVQYFAQRHGRHRPFPRLTNATARSIFAGMGIQAGVSGDVDRIGTIEAATLDPNPRHRGSGMPAILTSAVMHRRGNLHVPPTVIDDGDDSPNPTQGRWIEGTFRDLLRSRAPTIAADYVVARDAITATTPDTAVTGPPAASTAPLAWLRANSAALTVALPAVARATYAAMRDIMRPAIEPALRGYELTWYEQLAAARGHSTTSGPYHVTSPMIARVAQAAHDNNDRLMASWR